MHKLTFHNIGNADCVRIDLKKGKKLPDRTKDFGWRAGWAAGPGLDGVVSVSAGDGGVEQQSPGLRRRV